MKKHLLYSAFLVLSMAACKGNKNDQIENWKSEIVKTENDFSAMAGKSGLEKAFVAYSADDVNILRNDTILKGKAALQEFYKKRDARPGKVMLSWSPNFVDVSSSGDLGYTYGKYVYIVTDSLGDSKSFTGIFHTVWKRQHDGSWKFVWD